MADAHDNSPGACKIEDWRWYPSGSSIVIEGTTTCAAGRLQLRLYDGSGADRKFLGVSRTYIQGHIFHTMVNEVKKPADLAIEYAIRKKDT